jgi:hypothetical protein
MLLTTYPGSSIGATSKRRGLPLPIVTITSPMLSVCGEYDFSRSRIFAARSFS